MSKKLGQIFRGATGSELSLVLPFVSSIPETPMSYTAGWEDVCSNSHRDGFIESIDSLESDSHSLLSIFIIQLVIKVFFSTAASVKDNFLQPEFFFLAVVFSLVAQAGDLTISYFKRSEKIKDMGKILPGHGGILDRIDGLMFVVILTLILYKLNIIP